MTNPEQFSPSSSPNTSITNIYSLDWDENTIGQADVTICYYNDYIEYKKLIHKSHVLVIGRLMEIFDDKFSQTIVKLLILYRRDKIPDVHYNLFKPIVVLIDMLQSTVYIDQNDMFFIILNIWKIYKSLETIKEFFETFRFKDFFDYKHFTNNIEQLFNYVKSFNTLLELIELIELRPGVLVQDNGVIDNFSCKLSYKYFMYYDGARFYKTIGDEIGIFYDSLFLSVGSCVGKNKQKNVVKSIVKFMNNFKSLESYLMMKYNHFMGNHLNVYWLDEVNLNVKFRYEKTKSFIGFLNNWTDVCKL